MCAVSHKYAGSMWSGCFYCGSICRHCITLYCAGSLRSGCFLGHNLVVVIFGLYIKNLIYNCFRMSGPSTQALIRGLYTVSTWRQRFRSHSVVIVGFVFHSILSCALCRTIVQVPLGVAAL